MSITSAAIQNHFRFVLVVETPSIFYMIKGEKTQDWNLGLELSFPAKSFTESLFQNWMPVGVSCQACKYQQTKTHGLYVKFAAI
jgi:hypothetical protein